MRAAYTSGGMGGSVSPCRAGPGRRGPIVTRPVSVPVLGLREVVGETKYGAVGDDDCVGFEDGLDVTIG